MTRGAIVALAVLAWSGSALAAPDTKECIASFDKGQRSKSDGALRRAHTELLVCTHETCPAVLRADCAGVLADVDKAIPTIVLAADDGLGHDIADVKVYAGDELLASRIDGKPLERDPGSYTYRFVRGIDPPLTVPVTIRAGEKNRVVRASFPPPPSAIAKKEKPVTPPPPPPEPERSTIGWVIPSALGVLGVGSLTVAGISRLRFDSQVSDYRSENGCAPECTPSQRDDLSKTLVTSNVALIAGTSFIAAAVITWIVLAPSSARSAALTRGPQASPRAVAW
jgi:hypothetical protein